MYWFWAFFCRLSGVLKEVNVSFKGFTDKEQKED